MPILFLWARGFSELIPKTLFHVAEMRFAKKITPKLFFLVVIL